jgi:acyl-CoA dehydrogenase
MLGNMLLAKAGLHPVEGLIALAFADDGVGVLHDVPWGEQADHILVVTPTGIALTGASTWSAVPALDTGDEPRDTLTGAIGRVIALDTSSAFATAAILRGGQILGAIEWTLARSIDYAGERKQFGREISKFQVIQQMLAELAAHMLASAVLTEAAAETVNQTMVAAARSRLADAADAAITIAHQVHGALGFSKEYALNHRTRRLMAWRDDYGSVQHWRRSLASGFVSCSRESFWPTLADAGGTISRPAHAATN